MAFARPFSYEVHHHGSLRKHLTCPLHTAIMRYIVAIVMQHCVRYRCFRRRSVGGRLCCSRAHNVWTDFIHDVPRTSTVPFKLRANKVTDAIQDTPDHVSELSAQ